MKNSSLSNCSDLVAFPYPMHMAQLVLWSVHNLAQNLTAPNRVYLISIMPHQAISTSFRCLFLFPWTPNAISTSIACLNHFVLSMDNWYLFLPARPWSHPVYSSPCCYSPFCHLSTSIRSYSLRQIKYTFVLFQQDSKLSAQHSPWRCLNAIDVPTPWRFWWTFINRLLCKWQPAPLLLPGEFHGQRSLVG